jgi:hypothetical protein
MNLKTIIAAIAALFKSKSLSWIVVAAFVLAIGGSIIDDVSQHGATAAALADVKKATDALKLRDAQFAAAQDAADAVIADRDKQIAAFLAVQANPQPSPAELAKDKVIADLKAQVAVAEVLNDCPKALAACKSEVSAWTEKFNLADAKHRQDIASLNNLWQGKYDGLSGKYGSLSAKTDAALARITADDIAMIDLKRDLRKARLAGTAKLTLAGAAVGYIIAGEKPIGALIGAGASLILGLIF